MQNTVSLNIRAEQEAKIMAALRRVDDMTRQIIVDLVVSLADDSTVSIDNVILFPGSRHG